MASAGAWIGHRCAAAAGSGAGASRGRVSQRRKMSLSSSPPLEWLVARKAPSGDQARRQHHCSGKGRQARSRPVSASQMRTPASGSMPPCSRYMGAEASRRPSGDQAAGVANRHRSWLGQRCSNRPSWGFQSRISFVPPKEDAEASRWPSGEKAMPSISLWSSSSRPSGRPVSGSQSRTIQSWPPEASRSPSGDQATVRTAPSWPLMVRRQVPLSVSQSRTVPSSAAVASRRPSGDQAAWKIRSVWPARRIRDAPVVLSQIRQIWSYPALASRWPSGLKAQSGTPPAWGSADTHSGPAAG